MPECPLPSIINRAKVLYVLFSGLMFYCGCVLVFSCVSVLVLVFKCRSWTVLGPVYPVQCVSCVSL